MSNNIQRLGETLASRMAKTANAAVTVAVEFATVNENMSLTPDSLQVAIPQGDYLITAGQDPQKGDRVLIAWCGNDPVIVGPAATETAPSPGQIDIKVTSDGDGNVTMTW